MAGQRDLLEDRRTWSVLWGMPYLVFAVGFALGPPAVAWLWLVALFVLGLACVVNAARCGRRHCYFTGPFYLLGAVISLVYGFGILASWTWIALGVTMIIGGQLLTRLPERDGRRYTQST